MIYTAKLSMVSVSSEANKVKEQTINSLATNEFLNTFMTKICEKMNCKVKTASRITAVYQTNKTKKEMFKFTSPVNQCKAENCDFCCLSTNRCGTKLQCDNNKKYMFYFHIIFFALAGYFLFVLIIKCYQLDGMPDQTGKEKIDKQDIADLLSVFSIIRRNKKNVNHETQIE